MVKLRTVYKRLNHKEHKGNMNFRLTRIELTTDIGTSVPTQINPMDTDKESNFNHKEHRGEIQWN